LFADYLRTDDLMAKGIFNKSDSLWHSYEAIGISDGTYVCLAKDSGGNSLGDLKIAVGQTGQGETLIDIFEHSLWQSLKNNHSAAAKTLTVCSVLYRITVKIQQFIAVWAGRKTLVHRLRGHSPLFC
jgi:hypothetical protein